MNSLFLDQMYEYKDIPYQLKQVDSTQVWEGMDDVGMKHVFHRIGNSELFIYDHVEI